MANIIKQLDGLNDTDLIELNAQIIRKLKTIRATQAAELKSTLKVGDKVTWNCRQGSKEGVIYKVNRKKAIVEVNGEGWNVPLGMLKKVV